MQMTRAAKELVEKEVKKHNPNVSCGTNGQSGTSIFDKRPENRSGYTKTVMNMKFIETKLMGGMTWKTIHFRIFPRDLN